ncbi:MAG: hypothetical protein GJU76_12945 [Gallionella sp.]|jgi:hypothetical protein|nr:hypothetical protein [Gallionella sp.]
MCPETVAPSFDEFLRFVASKHHPSEAESMPTEREWAAARIAREALRALSLAARPENRGGVLCRERIEVLELLAASSQNTTRPSELVTVRGFRVQLDYRDGTGDESSSLCVLVKCPEQWVERVQGRIAYLWNGTERFELGEFDTDGKALGTLPAGIEISLSDFATGRVKLEAPDVPEHE